MADSDIWERMFRPKNGETLKSLYLRGSSGDASRDDLKFCSAVAYFSNSNLAQMESIFKSCQYISKETLL